mmetsp:Transcript_2247/g.5600  ORF Transcript_2247/g.5600 Transcript_2247/m.5600 type:complete len:401 (-) Transcript_2247:918-2120(-)
MLQDAEVTTPHTHTPAGAAACHPLPAKPPPPQAVSALAPPTSSELVPLDAHVARQRLQLLDLLVAQVVRARRELLVQRVLRQLAVWLLAEGRRPLARDLHVPHAVVRADELEDVLRLVRGALEPVGEVPVSRRGVLHGGQLLDVVLRQRLGERHVHLHDHELLLQQVGQVAAAHHLVQRVLQVQRVQAGAAGVDRQHVAPRLLRHLAEGVLVDLADLGLHKPQTRLLTLHVAAVVVQQDAGVVALAIIGRLDDVAAVLLVEPALRGEAVHEGADAVGGDVLQLVHREGALAAGGRGRNGRHAEVGEAHFVHDADLVALRSLVVNGHEADLVEVGGHLLEGVHGALHRLRLVGGVEEVHARRRAVLVAVVGEHAPLAHQREAIHVDKVLEVRSLGELAVIL